MSGDQSWLLLQNDNERNVVIAALEQYQEGPLVEEDRREIAGDLWARVRG